VASLRKRFNPQTFSLHLQRRDEDSKQEAELQLEELRKQEGNHDASSE